MKDLSLDEVYIYQLERTVRQIRRYKSQFLEKKGFDLSSEQWVVIKRLSESPGLKQRELAQQTFKDPASMTRILDILQNRGLVERRQVEGDRRTYSLYLTNTGEDTIERLMPLALEAREQGLKGISASELAQLNKTLNKIHDNFS